MEKLRFLDLEDLYVLSYLGDGMQIRDIAKKMHVTQPAISRRLINLCDELGYKTHKRLSYNIEITEKGKLLAIAAKSCIEILSKAIG